jgi:lipopolysaccharide transport system permease protein
MMSLEIFKTFGNRAFWLQVYMTTISNLKARYRNTFAGMFWVILGPLVVYGVQSFIFTQVLWINVPDYSQFLLSGLLAWIFVSQSIDQCTPLLINHRSLLTAFSVDPLVLIMAQLFDNFLNFLIAFTVLVTPILLLADSRIRLAGLLVFPIAAAILVAGTFGLCWLLAISQVFFRDTRFIMSFMVSVGYYLTPIFYPIYMVPEKVRWILELNPLYRLIDPLRVCIYNFQPEYFWPSAFKGACVALSLLVVASYTWRRRRNEIFLQL